jgi:spore germination protein GerM
MAKKLKRIDSGVVSYVRINGQAAKDHNDKMLAVSYAHSKLNICEWYIELLDSGSKKYAVPHTREYLVSIKNQLLAAIEEIINAPVNQGGKSSSGYPEGYDG